MGKPELHPEDHPELTALNARAGLILFAIYFAIYATFVAVSAFWPDVMAQPTALGPNLAILYGFGLIFGAILLSLVYMVLCGFFASSVGKRTSK